MTQPCAIITARFDDFHAATVEIERHFVADYVDEVLDALLRRADSAAGGLTDLTVAIEWLDEEPGMAREVRHIAYHLDLYDRRSVVVEDQRSPTFALTHGRGRL